MFIRAPYNYDVEEASRESGLECLDKSLAVQSQRDEADINTIVKRFGLTGVLPQVAVPPTYGDFDQIDDYRTALEVISRANASFAALHPDVRTRFQNNPALFVDFCMDAGNLEEMRKMGLAIPKENVNVVNGEVPGSS